MSYPTWDHLKEDGVYCDSPALRGQKFCYFHLNVRARRLARVRGPRPKIRRAFDFDDDPQDAWPASGRISAAPKWPSFSDCGEASVAAPQGPGTASVPIPQAPGRATASPGGPQLPSFGNCGDTYSVARPTPSGVVAAGISEQVA